LSSNEEEEEEEEEEEKKIPSVLRSILAFRSWGEFIPCSISRNIFPELSWIPFVCIFLNPTHVCVFSETHVCRNSFHTVSVEKN
jgi:hypothetical protein